MEKPGSGQGPCLAMNGACACYGGVSREHPDCRLLVSRAMRDRVKLLKRAAAFRRRVAAQVLGVRWQKFTAKL